MRWRGIIAALSMAAIGIGMTGAKGSAGSLTGWGQGGFGIISDGTSNTIQFGETTRFDICFDGVGVPGGITDGTSNTILFGENAGFFIVPGASGPRVPIGTISDGSSNTIFIGENLDLCLRDVAIGDPPAGGIGDGASNTIVFEEHSRFDICLRNVQVTQSVTDGSSNTIMLGETFCYEDLQVADTVAAVPAPATLALVLGGVAALLLARRRSLLRFSRG
jgi:hypothetical protein